MVESKNEGALIVSNQQAVELLNDKDLVFDANSMRKLEFYINVSKNKTIKVIAKGTHVKFEMMLANSVEAENPESFQWATDDRGLGEAQIKILPDHPKYKEGTFKGLLNVLKASESDKITLQLNLEDTQPLIILENR